MTISADPTIETFTGIAKQFDGGWWAMCDQLPIASHGSSYNDAIKGILGSIEKFRTFSNGCGLPTIPPLERDPGTIPFEMKIAIH